MRQNRIQLRPRGLTSLFGFFIGTAGFAVGGGVAENTLLIIDPSCRDSMHVGNYYRAARDIPSANVIYMDPGAQDYATFVQRNLGAVRGHLAAAGITDHIDFIVIANPRTTYVDAPGLISDGCSSVTRFSLSAAYSHVYMAESVLDGMVVTTPNGYFSLDGEAVGYSSADGWAMGQPTTAAGAQRLMISSVLGYSGPRGNTVAETLAMIDRSVAADLSHPSGTFYFMRTPDILRSAVRHSYFPFTISSITAAGGAAEQLTTWLPVGRHDVLGVVTGVAEPPIEETNFTILPGAFCDHLTSWAAMFDNPFQKKVSRWIAKGASGSWGAVEEPCAYSGKFPNPRLHYFYYRGLTLGEACYRSVSYLPFQGLLYGDPLTRPFADAPIVSVNGLPDGDVSGVLTLTPDAVATAPGAQIDELDLLVDGVIVETIEPGQSFHLDTAGLSDGSHGIRVLAHDNTPVRASGRWSGGITVKNHGEQTLATVTPAQGDLATAFAFELQSSNDDTVELRIVQGDRLIAAAPGSAASFTIYGGTLGAGPVRVFAEALRPNGQRVRSRPIDLAITPTGETPSASPPTAFSYTQRVRTLTPSLVTLPATSTDNPEQLTYQLLSTPQQSQIVAGTTEPFRVIRARTGATGADSFTFQVSSPSGVSNPATLTLIYELCAGDLNGSGSVDLADLSRLLANFGSEGPVSWDRGDVNADGAIDLTDLTILISSYMLPCR